MIDPRSTIKVDSDNEVRTKNIWSKIVSWNGLIVALIPFVGYLIYFTITFRTFYYFNIPISFMSFNIQDVFSSFYAGLNFYFFILFLGFLLFPFLMLLVKNKKEFWHIFLLLLLMVLFSILLYLVSEPGIAKYISIGNFLLFVFFIVSALILEKLPVSKVKTLRFVADKIVFLQGLKPLLVFLNSWKNLLFFFFISYFFVSLQIYGDISVKTKTKYYVVKNANPQCLVLYMTQERIVCAEYTVYPNRVTQEFRVIFFTDEPKPVLDYIEMGTFSSNPSYISSPLIYPTPIVSPPPQLIGTVIAPTRTP